MAEVIRQVPRDTVVVERDNTETRENRSSSGVIIAVIIIAILLLLLIAGNPFSRSNGGPTITTPTPTSPQ